MAELVVAALVLSAACDEARGAPARQSFVGSGRIDTQNECLLSNETLLFHVLFEVDYAASTRYPASKSRTIYQLKCERETKACS